MGELAAAFGSTSLQTLGALCAFLHREGAQPITGTLRHQRLQQVTVDGQPLFPGDPLTAHRMEVEVRRA